MEEQKTPKARLLGLVGALLLVAVVMTLPYAIGRTWSLPGADSDRTLTYTPGCLTWDSDADLDENGVLRLSMFRPDYQSVHAQNGERLVAPGTEKTTSVRLLNSARGKVAYTAVLYRLDDQTVPVTAELSGGAAVAQYTLPQGVSQEQVVNAVGGTIDGGSLELLDVDWLWQFYESTAADGLDTGLGNAPDQVEYGLYIGVSDDNTYYTPVSPNTGDHSYWALWLLLAGLSLTAVVLLCCRARGRNEE